MKLSRRALIQGLTASAAAHTLGHFKTFAAPLSLPSKDVVVFLLGHAHDDLFLAGVNAALQGDRSTSLTVIRHEGDLLQNLDALRQGLSQHAGKRALAYMDPASHAVFQELVRESHQRLLSVGCHSWNYAPALQANHLILSSGASAFSENLATLMADAGWSFHMHGSSLVPFAAPSVAAPLETGTLPIHSIKKQRNSMHDFNLSYRASSPSLANPAALASLLGFALAQTGKPAHVASPRPSLALQTWNSSMPLRPESAVTLLMEL